MIRLAESHIHPVAKIDLEAPAEDGLRPISTLTASYSWGFAPGYGKKWSSPKRLVGDVLVHRCADGYRTHDNIKTTISLNSGVLHLTHD